MASVDLEDTIAKHYPSHGTGGLTLNDNDHSLTSEQLSLMITVVCTIRYIRGAFNRLYATAVCSTLTVDTGEILVWIVSGGIERIILTDSSVLHYLTPQEGEEDLSHLAIRGHYDVQRKGDYVHLWYDRTEQNEFVRLTFRDGKLDSEGDEAAVIAHRRPASHENLKSDIHTASLWFTQGRCYRSNLPCRNISGTLMYGDEHDLVSKGPD
jgi:hypothetical protein